METKIRKLIRNISEDKLRSFLINYNLDLPENFTWECKSKNYYNILCASIWNYEDDNKQNLFDSIERIYDMSDELGQNALCAVICNNETFLDQKSDYARSLWVYLNHPDKFRTAEHYASHDYKRKSKEWNAFIGPKNREIDKSVENIAEFKKSVLNHLDISKKLNLEFSCRDKKDNNGNKFQIYILIAFHDGLPQSIQTFDNDEVVTKYFSPANDFGVSYDPIGGLIEVISSSKDNREFLAKKFANIFLKTEDDKFGIRLKKYNLSKFRSYQDLMKDVDAKDMIENIKVTLLKLKPLNSKNSNTLESPFSEKRTIYEIVQDWYAGNNPLAGSFEIKKVKLSIKFKADDKSPRGKLIHVNITEPNGCDLKDRTEKEKIIGDKYLEKWGIIENI